MPPGNTYIPGKDDEHGAHGHLADKPLEALLCLTGGIFEKILADFDEVLGSLYGRGNFFGRVSDGASHLDSELVGQLILLLIDYLEGLLDDVLALLQRGGAP